MSVGQGHRFVLLRGLAREAGHWHDFELGLRERFPDATFERHDLAGNGDQWPRASPTSIVALTEDLRRRVWAAGRRPPVIVAISLGAMVGLTWVSRWPTELRALVTINTSAGALSPPLRRLQPIALLHTLRALLDRDAVARERRILALTTRHHADNLELADRHARLLEDRPIGRINVIRQMLAAADFRVDPRTLPTEHSPILMLVSKGDRMVHPTCTDALAAAFGACRRIHDDAGHDLTLDDPRWCNVQIADWLDAVSR